MTSGVDTIQQHRFVFNKKKSMEFFLKTVNSFSLFFHWIISKTCIFNLRGAGDFLYPSHLFLSCLAIDFVLQFSLAEGSSTFESTALIWVDLNCN